MANTKISDFTSGAPAQSTDAFVIARTGANFKLAASDIKTLVVGAGSVSVASGKTLTANNTLTLAGTDGTTMTFPSTSATIARTDAGNTFTGNQVVSSGSFGLSGNISAAAWTTNGIRYANSAATLTDTTSSGTVAAAYTDLFGGNTIAASNATTFTDYYTMFVSAATAGSNVTMTNKWALGLAGNLKLGPDASGTNQAGTNVTIGGSRGTGTGAGGSIIFQVAPAGSSGTAQNALVSTWQITGSGHLTLATDNTYDIGASGANRPRNVYVGNHVVAGGAITGSGSMQMGATGVFSASGRSGLSSPANGIWLMNVNAGGDFDRLQFGGTTSSFPALKRVSANLQVIAADNAGSAGLIVGNQALATTATDGFLYVPTCAGTPTGTPTTQTGTVPIVVDTTNNKLYFYSGAAWRDAGP